jgi:hypothetical protein
LEPLFLTAAPFDVIWADIGGEQVDMDVFKAYERLYFNVRLNDGKIHKSCQLRQYFAMPQGQPNPETPDEMLWRVIAANMGYDVLVSTWLWSHAHGMSNVSRDYLTQEFWRVAQSTMFLEFFGKRVSHFNMAAAMKSVTDHARMELESGDSSGKGNEMAATLMGVLSILAPVIKVTSKAVDEQPKLTADLQHRLLSQRNVSMQVVVDRGEEAGVEGLNKLMAEHFKTNSQE